MGEKMPAYAEFPQSEFAERWERARAAMRAGGFDALLVTSEANHRYLSGHVTQSWLNKFRPVYMIVPLVGDPVIVALNSEVSVVRDTSFIRDIRSFVPSPDLGVKELADAIGERGLGVGVIGCEFGTGQRLGMSLTGLHALERLLPGARFVDAGDLFWRLRLVKSPAEVWYLRRAGEINGRAVAKVLPTVREGWSEREVYQELATAVMAFGADRPGYIPVNADTHAPDSLTGGPTDRRLEAGHMVYVDTGCVHRGYWSDTARVFAVGRATDDQRRMYSIVFSALHRSLGVIRPGVQVSDIMRAALAEFEENGVPRHMGLLGRIGHGMGLDLFEPPPITIAADESVQAGMILCVEPNFATPEGAFILEENVLVTPEGTELLSWPAPPELPVVT